jgi:hypothetical protein
MKAGKVRHVTIEPEQGGILKIAIPKDSKVTSIKGIKGKELFNDSILTLNTIKGREVTIEM